MTKTIQSSTKNHSLKRCECVIIWLLEQKLTILNFFHFGNREIEQFYRRFVELIRDRTLCQNSPEAQAIIKFVNKRGEAYAKRGANDPTQTTSTPIININLPKKKDYERLPYRKK